MIEIRDAALALRWLLLASRARARSRLQAAAARAGSAGDHVTPDPAAVEGYALAEAVRVAQQETGASTSGATLPSVGTSAQDDVPAAADLAGEVAYLTDVARHFQRAQAEVDPAGSPADATTDTWEHTR